VTARRAALLLPLLLCSAACARAIKEAPPLLDLAGGGPAPAREEVDALLRDARAAFARREPASVRQAATLFLRAAAGDPARVEGVLGGVEAQVWLADHEKDSNEREAAATKAVQAAQWCERASPALPACSYWMGAALGVQARERPATGVSALPRIEAAFRKAADQDPTLDAGAPDRALALLYLRAPGWPTGPGDPERGLEHARKALAIAPEHPLNLMALAEALQATDNAAASRETWEKAAARARDLVAQGDPDAGEWVLESERALEGLKGQARQGDPGR
jgi:tetratricopeptide (TPR) repeat protein